MPVWKDAILPTFGSHDAIGLDLYACPRDRYDEPFPQIIIGSGHRYLCPVGIAVEIPRGYYGRIAPRSGLAHTYGIDVLAGVIDSDYRGELFVLLVNHDSRQFHIRQGAKVAQLILERADRFAPEWATTLTETARDAAGFGSTGV